MVVVVCYNGALLSNNNHITQYTSKQDILNTLLPISYHYYNYNTSYYYKQSKLIRTERFKKWWHSIIIIIIITKLSRWA